jgi:hypothetical protein
MLDLLTTYKRRVIVMELDHEELIFKFRDIEDMKNNEEEKKKKKKEKKIII